MAAQATDIRMAFELRGVEHDALLGAFTDTRGPSALSNTSSYATVG